MTVFDVSSKRSNCNQMLLSTIFLLFVVYLFFVVESWIKPHYWGVGLHFMLIIGKKNAEIIIHNFFPLLTVVEVNLGTFWREKIALYVDSGKICM